MERLVSAVVLAAGKSERMGRLKQLLPFGKRTVVETVTKTLQLVGCTEILVVLGHRASEIAHVLPNTVRTVVNEDYESGMFSSVLAGLNALDSQADGMLLLLGDQPQIRAGMVKAVIDRFAQSDEGIVIPVVDGKRGHPVVIDVRRYGEEIRDLDGSEGLKPVMRGHLEDTGFVEMDDEAILRDLDTPEDYEREIRLIQEQ
ncbi:MAG TPA: hypothetical protein DHW45_13175 [Candidatus Latescibacteria bacterium]|jgi:molybdenum cofactor cytidylyltransferase|nr:hypothetical protein [Candidatus Latescibacterota bacterium]|tara:strand:- start:103 stop:705 length:603 start_codon:yes stop_codon:yes gene_type:complete